MKRILIADVSKWNYVNYHQLWKGGVRGIIIKAGQYNLSQHKFTIDPLFERHYKGAQDSGMLCGAYYYSTASNETESKEEVEEFLKVIKGKVWLLPLCGDYENKRYGSEELESIIQTAGDRIEDYNYYFMAYMDKDNYLRASEKLKDKYAIWIADWENNSERWEDVNGVKMHQFTYSGTDNGVAIWNEPLDLSRLFYNIPQAIFLHGLFGPEMIDIRKNKTWKNIADEIINTVNIWGVE